MIYDIVNLPHQSIQLFIPHGLNSADDMETLMDLCGFSNHTLVCANGYFNAIYIAPLNVYPCVECGTVKFTLPRQTCTFCDSGEGKVK